MSSELDREPYFFAQRFLESAGAIIEEDSEAFEALLPEELSSQLEVPEQIRIKAGSPTQEGDAYRIGYGSSLLERMTDVACGSVCLTGCRLTFDYLKSNGFDRLASDMFRFSRAALKVVSSAPVKTHYFILTCRFLAQSDEQKEGLLSFPFHLETGAFVPEMAGMLDLPAKEFRPPNEFYRNLNSWDWKKVLKALELQAHGIILEELREFKESMDRRLKRDVAHLEEYYEALKAEMEKSLQRPGLSEQLIEDRRGKINLIPSELAQKKTDLVSKYSIKAKLTPCAGMFVSTPAVKILCEVLIGRRKKGLSLVYNPVTKSLDPLVCQGCSRSITKVFFCPQHHLLCPFCHEKCPLCSPPRRHS
ncbi:MAG: hypothetical protein V1758_02295 [Pseudomonadota bacterium]